MKFKGRTVAAIVEFPNGSILLVKRSTPPFKDYWALPGGKVNAGEAAEHAIVREVKEETGLDVEIMKKTGEYHEKGIQNGMKYDYHPACFLARPIGGKLRRQEGEIEQISLFSFKEIPERLAFEHARMVRDYQA